ncbi:hypothetical protein OJ253_2656 [Cryptosporidium canis]|uniref:Uncharacterized protein n=1 Tax=Cryptosporidium canis TaxID=195482 RepID=A0A9D5HXZ6_9CRYT|nr:hypothetical protein OJ253_2656 [Cryptosporidium canis]
MFSGSSMSCRGVSIWSDILMLYNTSKYAFDVSFDDESLSFLYMNNLPEYWDSNLVYWSEAKQSGSIYDDALSVFQVYNLELCDSMITENVSSNWLAALDFSSTCLSLPPFLFARLVKWLPLECPEDLTDINKLIIDKSKENHPNDEPVPYSSLCIVKKRPLPVASFWLSQMDHSNDQLEPLRIFLDDYVVRYNNTDYLCILNSLQSTFGKINYLPYNEEYSSNNYFPYYTSSSTPLILFGSLLLKSYGILIDNNSGKIGFYSKFKYKQNDSGVNKHPKNFNCKPKKECPKGGGFHYEASTNECIPPNCSEWLLYEFNDETNKCELSSVFPLVLTFIVILFTFFEIHIMYLKQFVLDRSSEVFNS